MATYAIHDGTTVLNVILADTLEIAQAVTPEGLYVLECDDDGCPGMGWIHGPEGWRQPQPYPSWVWNKKAKAWEAPVPVPQDGQDYVWDESTVDWVAPSEFSPEG